MPNLIFFIFAFCLQGSLCNGLFVDALPIMPIWLRLLPFYMAKALLTTSDGILIPKVLDFIIAIFFNLVNTLLICLVLYALWSLHHKDHFIHRAPGKTGSIPQNKSHLLLALLLRQST
ncbi:hypothetical protein [Oligella urethralis]|uniref:hypothetical protein n=1 Tax=Oligella urethralis TaxID=90245 RepID=UPI000DD99FD0|nr:hypothetical protein [Oligella urethralis]